MATPECPSYLETHAELVTIDELMVSRPLAGFDNKTLCW
jgi:hypothetical protein